MLFRIFLQIRMWTASLCIMMLMDFLRSGDRDRDRLLQDCCIETTLSRPMPEGWGALSSTQLRIDIVQHSWDLVGPHAINVLQRARLLEEVFTKGTEQFLHIPGVQRALRSGHATVKELAQQLASVITHVVDWAQNPPASASSAS